MKTLIVCDVQPDVVQKLPQSRQFVDLIHTCIAAARQKPRQIQIVHLMLHFPDNNNNTNNSNDLEKGGGRYDAVPVSHPRLGILRKLSVTNPNLTWFASSELSVKPLDDERTMTRTTYLPHANDVALLDGLRRQVQMIDGTTTETTTTGGVDTEVTVVGYGPTVQAVCNILGDILAVPQVQILRECVRDEKSGRSEAYLDHGLLFNEQVVSLVDFLESLDLLYERIDTPSTDLLLVSTPTITSTSTTISSPPGPPVVKYVVDCGRGGHLPLFLPYLLNDHGYALWPKQPWYKEPSLTSNKEYFCPLGRRPVELCDEPQFGYGTKFFIAGRRYLDEKDLLYDLVPELLPPTFASVEAAREYAQRQSDPSSLIWFLKKVNQNGGRAITISHHPPHHPLERDDQLQVHIPRPLLYHENHERQGQFKCHVKTYQYLACNSRRPSSTPAADDDSTTIAITTGVAAVEWVLYIHDCFYLATANAPWSTKDLSDDAQITTMRTHRLYADNAWRVRWDLTGRIRSNLTTVIQRAVNQGKLQSQHSTVAARGSSDSSPFGAAATAAAAALQFEVLSADWMLDEDGQMYLIEINGIPVLYDAGMPQDLCTKGLRLYDRLYKADPDGAVVNDHDLLREAIGLALTGRLPKTSLWKHVTTIIPPR